ncbi:hypothetical protein BJY52DRAFT_1300553 [Lactarius psammicola]|nr:hypothetical protein BJY52DRAFT_1300553 [Lactarius psammicola]
MALCSLSLAMVGSAASFFIPFPSLANHHVWIAAGLDENRSSLVCCPARGISVLVYNLCKERNVCSIGYYCQGEDCGPHMPMAIFLLCFFLRRQVIGRRIFDVYYMDDSWMVSSFKAASG